jgi:hypothetical protein
MAPERPRSLVILDLREPEARDGGTVYHWDPVSSDRELVMLWEAVRSQVRQYRRHGFTGELA